MTKVFPALVLAALATGALATAALAQRAPAPNPNPFAGNAQAVAEGMALYNRSCTACHGFNGTAGEFAPGLGQPGRRYNRRSDAQIFDAVKNGIPGSAMPAGAGRLSDEEAWKVVSYVLGLRGTAVDAPAPGDAAHGAEIFWGKGACGTCHMIRGRGSLIGPELSNIAGMRKTNSILDALTKSDHRVFGDGGAIPHTLLPLATYQRVRVTPAKGAPVEGLLRNEDSYSLQIMGMDQQLHLFDRAGLRAVEYLPGSLMPSDYDKRLTPQEFNDLLAFLTRQAAGRETATPSAVGDPD
ncbi:MAG: c-type cytochrome [Alphaproteobacteria bacterium]|nr:c-type cytochrome [Alphaproteobacteria bacterium]